MKINTQYICFAMAIAALATGCSSTKNTHAAVNVVNVQKLTNATAHSVVYSLPVTALRVEVTAVKTVKKTGPFYRYAQKYFNVTNVVTEDTEEWTIKSVNVVPYGKPDGNRTYAIVQDGTGVAQNISVNGQGVLCGINVFTPCPCTDAPAMTAPVNEPTIDNVNFDAVPMLEKQLLATSSATMADETAQYIYKLRKRRSRIFTSDYPNLPPDGRAYDAVEEEINQMEHRFMELFTGKTVTMETVRYFEFVPSRQSLDNNVLFRFSAKKGFVDRMDLSGTPVYAEVKDLALRTLPNTPAEEPKHGSIPNGLQYTLPGCATVTIVDKNLPLFQKEFELAQFGYSMTLPTAILAQPNIKIELSPVTGAILRMTNN